MEVKRREFLKQAAAAAAGAIVVQGLPLQAQETPKATGPSVLSVATGKDYEALVKLVLKPLGGMAAFVKSGQNVVVKPNIGWDRTPELGANTHPLVVKAVVAQALEAGAKQVLVYDYSCNNPKLCYKNSGIADAIASLNDSRVRLEEINKRRFVTVKIERGRHLSEWQFYRDAIEADVYINLPTAKHHALTKLTLGMKNIMGTIDNRGQMHANMSKKKFPMGQQLADLNSLLEPDLTIVDATRLLLRNGPTGGRPEDVQVCDTLIASHDLVAADAYATTLFGMKPEEIESTVCGHALGLGEIAINDPAKVKVVKAKA